MSPFLPEVLQRCAEIWRAEAALRLAVLVVAAAAAWLLYRRRRAPSASLAPPLALGLALVIGLSLALRRASVVDDAFIALRYARNLAEGRGLVFNPGERVEGYTDFLWVLLLAAGTRIRWVEPPVFALVLNVAAFAALILACAAVTRRLFGARSVPFAALLLALCTPLTYHATTGLETGFTALLALLAGLALARPASARSASAAGLALTLATLTRPDAILLFGAGALGVLAREGLTRGALRSLLAYGAPFSLRIAHLAWAWSYYGDYVPNTYYAKSANLPYWSQGVVYAADLFLGAHLWLPALLFLGWCARGSPETRGFRAYAASGAILHTVYVVRVGGDFMSGRFFVPLLPLLFVGCQGALHALSRADRRALFALTAGALLATAHSSNLRKPGSIRWYIADEGTIYPVSALGPLQIEHRNWEVGTYLRDTFTARRVRPRIAAGTIGMLGYYSRLRLIDTHGLTDATVAKQELTRRRHVGHEKKAEMSYLRRRRVHFLQADNCPYPGYEEIVALTPREKLSKPWFILVYDRELMDQVRERVPEWSFLDFEAHLDAYIQDLSSKARADVEEDMVFFRRYYFNHNEDPARLAPLEARLSAEAAPEP